MHGLLCSRACHSTFAKACTREHFVLWVGAACIVQLGCQPVARCTAEMQPQLMSHVVDQQPLHLCKLCYRHKRQTVQIHARFRSTNHSLYHHHAALKQVSNTLHCNKAAIIHTRNDRAQANRIHSGVPVSMAWLLSHAPDMSG